MKELLEKLSSYNIFNYLLPGIVFVVLAEALTGFNFIQKNIILGVFVYYFIGLIISRLGSIAVEPFLKLIRFVRFSTYSDFAATSKGDEKLLVLSEENNMYRTFCSLFAVIAFLRGYEYLSSRLPCLQKWNVEILVGGLLVLFCLAYRKQTQYITKRVECSNTREE